MSSSFSAAPGTRIERPAPESTTGAKPPVKSLSGLVPFLRPYRGRIALAGLFLVLAALATLAFPLALRSLIDGGLMGAAAPGLATPDRSAQVMALRGHFLALFSVAVALGIFSAGRFYMVSWLGERVTADLRNAVYAHVLRQSPEFFETTQTGEVLSRLTTDTTLVQTVVGSSLSMGLRNAVMGVGALAMLVWTNPWVMLQVAVVLVGVVLPSLWFGRRVRKLSRASQDRVADSSAIAAEVLNAIPVVQSYTAEGREAMRFDHATGQAFLTAVRRTRARAVLVAFIIIATSAALLWGLYQGTQAVMEGRMSAGHLGQTVVYVIILAGASAVLGEVYGDLLRAAGATERLMELLHSPSSIVSPKNPAQPSGKRSGSAIEFEKITFHYPSRPGLAALTEFSLRVAPGETVALVGTSGAGKSTVFQLLLRYYDAQAGALRIDDIAVQALALDDLRQRIAIVPQDAVIFSTRRWRTSATAVPMQAMLRSRPPRRPLSPTNSSARCPKATAPSWVNAACVCLAGSASASRSRVPCSRTPRCSCLTKPPARWTPKASAWFRRRWRPSWKNTADNAPRWSSPIAWLPCKRPTASWYWSMDALSSRAITRHWSPQMAFTRDLRRCSSPRELPRCAAAIY